MRILLVGAIPVEKGGSHGGGIATHVWELAENLLKRGNVVGIFAENLEGTNLQVIERIGVWGSARGRRKRMLSTFLKSGPTFLKGLIKERGDGLARMKKFWWRQYYIQIVSHFKPDIVHSHLVSHPLTSCHWKLFGNSLPLLTTVHSWHSILYSRGEREYLLDATLGNLRSSELLITVAPGLIEEAKELKLPLPRKIEVIPNPFSTKIFCGMEKEEAKDRVGMECDTPLILFVGSLVKRKGEEDLLSALKILNRMGQNFRLVMLGSGPNEDTVREKVRKEGLEDRTILKGPVPREDVASYLRAADLLVLPSYSESLPFSIIEAYASGTPVVTTHEAVSKARALLYPGPDFGILVKAGHPEDLAEAIKEALRREWNRDKLISYSQSFSWEKAILQYERIYEEFSA